MLSATHKTAYQQNGFLVLPDFKSAAEIAAVRAQAQQIVDAFDPRLHKSIFTTKEQVRTVGRYFLDSQNQMHYFFEEKAFDTYG